MLTELTKKNLILKFKVGVGLFTEDFSGNKIEEVKEIIVYASVKEDTYPKQNQTAGIGFIDCNVVGKVVDKDNKPFYLPEEVNFEMNADAELILKEKVVKGVFRFLPVIESRFNQITDTLGQRIKGYIRSEFRN